MSDFLISALAGLDPYVPGEQPQGREYIKLNTNESPFPPSPRVLDALSREEVSHLNLYSDPTALPLRRAIAEQYGVSPDNVFCGNGSDEVLGFSFLAFADGAHPVTFPAVSYGFYRVFANLFRVPARTVPLNEDFTVPVEPFLGAGGMVVLANPNAPTGIALPLGEVERIVRANPDHIVLVDEAYVDFGGESCVSLTGRYPNLLVVQTYSKSRSMAGARLGYAIGNAALIQDLETIKFSTNPYNVNRLTLKAGAQALAEQAYYDKNCQRIMETRAYTARELEKLGFAVLPSQTNFLFARKPGVEGADVYRRLKERGVPVSYTHLDVYKRQVRRRPHLPRRRGRAGRPPPPVQRLLHPAHVQRGPCPAPLRLPESVRRLRRGQKYPGRHPERPGQAASVLLLRPALSQRFGRLSGRHPCPGGCLLYTSRCV